MKKESILLGVIGLLIGFLAAGALGVYAVNNDHHGMMRMMGMNTNHTHDTQNTSAPNDHRSMSMYEMSEDLKNKTGDDFDKAFVDMMIAHHEGAIDMALLAEQRAKHDEIKKLSKAIIEAQTNEITDMKQWREDWGYPSNEVMEMMHGNH